MNGRGIKCWRTSGEAVTSVGGVAWETFLEQMRLELGPASGKEGGVVTLSFYFLFSEALSLDTRGLADSRGATPPMV